ncbi:MAG: NAD+ synthase [Candidatus Omnitrophica bacterium]|nr:NAD+ synthase [Candidatus Omnitrophota bacterium]
MRVALAQINTRVGDIAGNTRKITEYVQKAISLDVDLLAFPELAICGYPPEDLLYKNAFIEDNIRALKEIASGFQGITLVVGFVDRDKDGNLYNAAGIIGEGRLKNIYRKQQLPNYGVFDEKRYFKPGKQVSLIKNNGIFWAVNICEDIWREDGPFKAQARKGARLLLNISSSPYDMSKLEERYDLLKKRAKQTKAIIGYVNLIGAQDELVFDGGSVFISPSGKVIAAGKQFEEDLIVTDIEGLGIYRGGSNKKASPRKAVSGKCEIVSALPKKYSKLERIYNALVLGCRDYIYKNGFRKAVVGLSGGIDSSIVAIIARDAIGAENVIGVTMPSVFTSRETKRDAEILARNLKIKLLEIPINSIFAAYDHTLAGEFSGCEKDITEENIQARIRGNILMALSNKFGWLVLTTGNKSELAVGYCTLYGDLSGGFAVIKDVFKTKVYELAALINSREKDLIPESIITRPPTAELRHNQKDQDTLPPYAILDEILQEYIEKRTPIARIRKKFPKELVSKVARMVDTSEYKRRQAPPGVKITQLAFGKDRRLPITNLYKEE